MVKNLTDDNRQIHFNSPISDDLIGKIVQRLVYANSNEQLQRQMDAEEEVERFLLEKDRVIEVQNQQLEVQNQELETLRQKLR